MKTIKRLLILTVFLLLFLSENSLAQQLHTIVLNVNTELLTDKKDIDKYANFGQEVGISNEDFTVLVNLNDDIEWIGISSSAPGIDSVFIKKIKGVGKLMDKDQLEGNKVVKGNVSKGKSGEKEKYKLWFSIKRQGEDESKSYQIDPVIRIP
jgi:hypothetical protein